MKRLTVISLGGGVQSSALEFMASEGAIDHIPLGWPGGQLNFLHYVVDNGRSLR